MMGEKGCLLEIPLTRKSIKYIPDIVYAQVTEMGCSNRVLKMDILFPSTKELLPAVVFITGGRFIYAHKESFLQLRMAVAEAGFVTASIEYRTAPTVRFPQPLEDVKAAIRYLRHFAGRFHIDGSNIGIMGESAGGYLSALAGVTMDRAEFEKGEYLSDSSRVNAVVDLYGLSDLTQIGEDFSMERQSSYHSAGAAEALWVNGIAAFGGKDGGICVDASAAAAANPLSYVDASAPPFLLMHGTKDTMVSSSQTRKLHEALLRQGNDSTYYLVENACHGGTYWIQPEIVRLILAFLSIHLKHA